MVLWENGYSWKFFVILCVCVCIHLWYATLCFPKAFLDLNKFWQRLQGIDIPSKWFASMWFLMFTICPSFKQTLHTNAVLRVSLPFLSFPQVTKFVPFSIMDWTWLSSSWISPDNKFGRARDLLSRLVSGCKWFVLRFVFSKLGLTAGAISVLYFPCGASSSFSTWLLRPFNWSSFSF